MACGDSPPAAPVDAVDTATVPAPMAASKATPPTTAPIPSSCLLIRTTLRCGGGNVTPVQQLQATCGQTVMMDNGPVAPGHRAVSLLAPGAPAGYAPPGGRDAASDHHSRPTVTAAPATA